MSPAPQRVRRLNLLLLLTALFASLTGTASGERTPRGMDGVAVVRIAERAQAAVQPARRAMPAVAVQDTTSVARGLIPAAKSAPLPAAYLPFERRLE